MLQQVKAIGVTILTVTMLAGCGGGGGGGSLFAPQGGTQPNAPAAPTGLVATDTPGDQGGSITLSWTVSTDPDVIGQRLYRGTTSGVYSVVPLATFADNTTTGFVDNNAPLGVTYYYMIRSFDTVQESVDSNEVAFASARDLPPNPVTAASAADVPGDSGGSVTISWTPSTSADVIEQRLYRGTASGVYDPTPVALFSDNTTTGYTDAGLTNTTPYFYGIRAYDGFNESTVVEVSVTPSDNIAPAAPTGVTGADTPNDNGGSIVLNWTPSISADVVAQRIYRGTGSGVYNGIPLATIADNTTATYTDSAIVDGTTYYYVVRAFDGENESIFNTEVSATGADNIVPTVTRVAPATLTDVALTSTARFTFSEAVTGVDATTLFIDGPAGAVTGTVSYANLDATFTPATGAGGLGLNTRYTISLTNGITDTGGNAYAGSTTVFTTAEGAWSTPAAIETGSLDGDTPQVAISANGNGLAVWQQSDGGFTNIYAAAYDKTTGWGAETLVETDNTGSAVAPYVAMDAQGNGIAVWYQHDGTRYNAWANVYDAATGWGAATLLETDNAGHAFLPRVAMDDAGNGIAVWFQSDGTRFNTWASVYDPTTGWGTATLIETDNTGNAQWPRVAMNGNGDAVAVWYQSDGLRDNVWANVYDPTTGWGAATLIETDNAGSAILPYVAMDSSGNAAAVWYQWDGLRYNVMANHYDPAAGWGTAAAIETDNSGGAQNPRVGFDGNGNALAVWQQSDGSRVNIWSNRYDAVAGTWGTAALIETDNSGGAADPVIAVDANGNAMAAWSHYDGTRNNIMAARYTEVGGWAAPALVETVNAGDAQQVELAVGPQGRMLAVWQQFDGVRMNVTASRFE